MTTARGERLSQINRYQRQIKAIAAAQREQNGSSWIKASTAATFVRNIGR